MLFAIRTVGYFTISISNMPSAAIVVRLNYNVVGEHNNRRLQ